MRCMYGLSTCSGGHAQMNIDVKPRCCMYSRYACNQVANRSMHCEGDM